MTTVKHDDFHHYYNDGDCTWIMIMMVVMIIMRALLQDGGESLTLITTSSRLVEALITVGTIGDNPPHPEFDPKLSRLAHLLALRVYCAFKRCLLKIIKSKGVQPKYLKMGSLFNEQCSCTTAVSAIPGEKFPEARHRAELQLNGTHHGRSRKGQLNEARLSP